jgi:sec-independent protein translocase protein TatA
MFGIGPLELVLVLIILLVLFGARRLPEMGRSLGSGMREFKEGITHPDADEQDRLEALPRGNEADVTSAPKARAGRD